VINDTDQGGCGEVALPDAGRDRRGWGSTRRTRRALVSMPNSWRAGFMTNYRGSASDLRASLDKFSFCSYSGVTLSAANQIAQDSDFACVPPAATLVVRQPAYSLAGGLLCPCESSLGGGKGGRHPDRSARLQPPDPAQGKPAKQPVLLPCARSWPSSRLWRLEPKPIIYRSGCRRLRPICRTQA
jgi:hypothetical protein